MTAPHNKARRMDEDKRLANIITRQTEAAIRAHHAMQSIKQWLDNDTAGKRFDPLKRDARCVMDELDAIAMEGAAFLPPKPQDNQTGKDSL